MLELPISDEDFTMKNSSMRSSPPCRGVRRPPRSRDDGYGRDDVQSVVQDHHLHNRQQNMTSRPYGRQHSVHDEGDFSIEESMYAINTPGRMDPVTK